MTARLGHVLYWTASAVAVLTVAFAIYRLLTALGDEIPTVFGVFIIAGLIWLVGRASLYVLTER